MFRITSAVLAAIVGVSVGCAGGTNGSREPGRTLPAYEGHATELFDDVIEPAAVGYELNQGSTPMAPLSSNPLRERAQVGDAVVRAHVTTVTSKEEDKGRTWQIGLHSIETLAGSGAIPADFTVEVRQTAPSSGIVRAFEGRLIGMTFIAFVREFARPGAPGEEDLHFHLAPDTKPDLAAVQAAVRIDQVR